MNINYNIATWEVSLLRSCINKVVQCLIEPTWYDGKTICASPTETITNVLEKVNCLEIPASLKEDIKEKTGPIMMEIYNWCKTYPFIFVPTADERMQIASSCMFKCLTPPVLTNYGNVDPVETIKVLLQQDLDPIEKFVLSVEYCLEDEMLMKGRTLLFQERDSIHKGEEDVWCKISSFWLACHGLEPMDRHNLDATMCSLGFEYAIVFNKQMGIEYFIEVSQEEFERILDTHTDNTLIYTGFPPKIYSLLFSRMNEQQREEYSGVFAKAILSKLVSFPYQHLFLQAAQSLMEHLSAIDYWKILLNIVQEAANPFKNYDYSKIFIGYWRLGSQQEWEVQTVDEQDIIFYILLMKDKRVMDELFTRISKKNLLEYLVQDENLCIIMQLIFEEEFPLMEIILIDCGMDNNDLVDRFNHKFASNNFHSFGTCRQIRTPPRPSSFGYILKMMEKFARRASQLQM